MMSPLQFDVCIPVYRNLRCLELAIFGWRKHISDPRSVRKFLLHVQDECELAASTAIVSGFGFEVEVVSIGNGPVNMVQPMNALFAASIAPWVVFAEQDLFLSSAPDLLVSEIHKKAFTVAGPVDTFFYDNINSRLMPHYGQYARLSGEPGFYHSSLIVMNRDAVSAKSKTPFSIPDGYVMHGTGCLGGESYYGLRINVGDNRAGLGFFRQQHGDYGYSAVISYRGIDLATHLYYSSRQTTQTFPSLETEWIEREELRFLNDYKKAP